MLLRSSRGWALWTTERHRALSTVSTVMLTATAKRMQGQAASSVLPACLLPPPYIGYSYPTQPGGTHAITVLCPHAGSQIQLAVTC
jgi:hypothetical protein